MKDIIKGCIAEIESDIQRVENSNFLPERAKSEKIEELKAQAQGLNDSNPDGDKGTYTFNYK